MRVAVRVGGPSKKRKSCAYLLCETKLLVKFFARLDIRAIDCHKHHRIRTNAYDGSYWQATSEYSR